MNPDTKKHISEAVKTHKKMTADFEKEGVETIAAIAAKGECRIWK
jgi:hypothetical protein